MALPKIFAEVGLKIDGFEKAAGEVSKRLNAIDREAQRALAGFQKIGDRLTQVGTSLSVGITAPLAAAAAGGLAFAANFESSLNRIRALGDITGKDLEKLRQQALKLGADTKYSAQEAADGMAEFAAAGFKANEIYDVMPGTLSLAAAGAISVADAAKLTKDILGQFRLEASKATEVADVLAKASAESSGSLLELGTSLTYAGPRAADLGISLNTTVAALIELDKAGIRGSEAGTQLRGVLASIVGPSKDAQKYINELGVNVKDAAGNFLPLPNVIEQFRAGLGKLGGDVERAKFLTEIFGREASNAASILINQGGPALEKYTELLDKSNGAADKQAKILNSGLKGAYEELKGSVETAAIAFGDVLLPKAEALAKGLQSFVNEVLIPAIARFKELPEPVQNIVLGLAAFAAAIGPVVFIAGQLVGAVTTLIPAMTSMYGAFLALASSKAVEGLVTNLFPSLIAAVRTFALTTVPSAASALLTFATTTIPAAIVAASNFSRVMLAEAGASMVNFAKVSVPAAIAALVTFTTTTVPAAAAAMLTFARSSIAAASSGMVSLATSIPTAGAGLAALGTTITTFVSGALASAGAALTSIATVALPLLAVAAATAAAAFAGWKLGEWAYEAIPAVKAFGDAIADLILKIPGVTTLIEKLNGAQSAMTHATIDGAGAIKKMEEALKAKGITVDKTGKSTEEYTAALQAAAREAGKLDKASDTAQIEKYKKQIQDSQKQAALYAKAQQDLGVKTAGVAKEHRDAVKPLENVALGTQLLAARMATLRSENTQAVTSLNTLKLAIDRGKAGSVDWAAELDKLTREMGDLGRASDDITKIKLPAWAAEIPKITRPNQELIDALGRLGVKSQEEYKKVADEAAKARDAVLGSNVATDFEKKSAIYKALQAQVEYSKIAGIEITREQRDALDQLGKDLDNKLPEQRRKWDSFTNGVSTAISNFSQDMVKSLFEGEGSWADKGLNALKKLGQAVLTSFVEPATAALTEFLNGVIKDLLGGKGFGGLIDGIKSIGSGLSGVFGGGGGGLSQGAGIPSTVPGIGGVLGGGTGAAGGAASGSATAASSLLSTLGAVGAIGSFASGVISNFQQHGMNVSLGRIEESTRFTAIGIIGPGGLIDTERTFLPWLEIIGRYLYGVQQPWFVDVSIYLERVIDSLALGYESARESMMMLSDIRGQLEFQNQLALEGGMGGGLTINVTGNTFATSGQIDQFVSVLTDRIARTIGYR